MDDLDNFLEKSFAILEQKEFKSKRKVSNVSADSNINKVNRKVNDIVKNNNNNNYNNVSDKVNLNFKNIITSDSLYSCIINDNTAINNKKVNIKEILVPYFPNENTYNEEVNPSRSFLLDKYINQKTCKKQAYPCSRKNKVVSDKYSNICKDLHQKLDFENLLGINQLWLRYINELLTGEYNIVKDCLDNCNNIIKINIDNNYLKKNYEGIMFKLLRADLNGSYCIVYDSKNRNQIGIEGLIILETKNSFFILNKKSQLKNILKRHSIFKLPLFDFKFLNSNLYDRINDTKVLNNNELLYVYINGDGFLYKASERTKVRFSKNK